MNLKKATLWSSIILILLGILTWVYFDAQSKMFSLSGNFLVTGLGILLISILVKVRK